MVRPRAAATTQAAVGRRFVAVVMGCLLALAIRQLCNASVASDWSLESATSALLN
jgi:hypothetical protein